MYSHMYSHVQPQRVNWSVILFGTELKVSSFYFHAGSLLCAAGFLNPPVNYVRVLFRYPQSPCNLHLEFAADHLLPEVLLGKEE